MSLHLNNKKCFLKIQGHLNKTETNWSVIYYSLLKIKMSATSVPITTLLWQFDMQWHSVNCIHIHLILKISMNAGVMTSNKSKQKALPNILLSLFKKVNISHLKLLFINDFAEKMNCHTYHFFYIRLTSIQVSSTNRCTAGHRLQRRLLPGFTQRELARMYNL